LPTWCCAHGRRHLESLDRDHDQADEEQLRPEPYHDFFAYDLNEPGIVAMLEQTGGRLRAIIDDSGAHAAAASAESQAAQRLSTSTGVNNVNRMHFKNLQHNKVLIAKKNGEPIKVLFGSTNFSFRGIYIQANNALVFYAPFPSHRMARWAGLDGPIWLKDESRNPTWSHKDD
jgi:hypothetical protein